MFLPFRDYRYRSTILKSNNYEEEFIINDECAALVWNV